MTVFERVVNQVAPHLREGALVVLRSTVYPGTTAYVTQHLAEAGCRVDVAFCPERIAEGHALEELRSLPGSSAPTTIARPSAPRPCSGRLVDKTVRTSTKEAELAKLFTNTWRYMKFAVANQFFMIADQAGVDYTNVLRAIREDYPALRTCRTRLRRRALPVQGRDAARGIHDRSLPDGPGRDAGQRGFARVHRRGARTPLHKPPRQDRRHPRHGVQGRVGRHPGVPLLQDAQAPVVGRRARPGHGSLCR